MTLCTALATVQLSRPSCEPFLPELQDPEAMRPCRLVQMDAYLHILVYMTFPLSFKKDMLRPGAEKNNYRRGHLVIRYLK